jgi:hypothetical protein
MCTVRQGENTWVIIDRPIEQCQSGLGCCLKFNTLGETVMVRGNYSVECTGGN